MINRLFRKRLFRSHLWRVLFVFILIVSFLGLTAQHAHADSPDAVGARIKARLEQQADGREYGLVFSRYDKDHKPLLDIRINDTKRYPAASSFKLFLVFDYYLNMPEANVDEASVHSVATFSNNYKTSWLLDDLYKLHPDRGNAIVQFNDFIASIGVQTGLYSWDFDRTLGYTDERFAPPTQGVDIHGVHHDVSNLFSAEQIAYGLRYYAQAELQPRWATDEVFQKAILKTRDALSIPAYNYVSPLEKVLPDNAMYGKDGVLPTEQLGFRVLNDARLVPMPDGGYYLIAFQSSGEGDYTAQQFLLSVAQSVNDYEAVINPDSFNLDSVPVSVPIMPNQYNYGFILPAQIDLFLKPDDNADKINNPWRTNLRLQTAYYMRGAMIRFMPLNDEWGQIVPDDPTDTVLDKQTAYVHLSDLQVIDPNIKPIDFITKPSQKWVVVDIFHHNATLFEGTTIILKTPVILNYAETPRGHFYVRSRYLERNMMPWVPFVPYTNFFDDQGHAMHGSPWHHWADTVTEEETIRRVTHGCINLPNWVMPIGTYNLPVDEFIYRWMGSMADPTHNTSEAENRTMSQAVAVYVVDNPDHLTDYALPDAARADSKGWNDLAPMILNHKTDAPDSFFGGPHS